MTTLEIELAPTLTLTDTQLAEICRNNRDLRFERTANGDLIVMSPTGSETGNRNVSISGQLWLWNQQKKPGYVFDSSTGFKLPNGAIRSPDASWIARDRWEALSAEEREKFAPICPDFVVELRSTSDRLQLLQEKMVEYIECGCRLGWLLDVTRKQVEVYRSNESVAILDAPTQLSGDEVLLGFELDLTEIFTP
ncbi:MAG: Uma2 family endonuclease [Cyanobacteria bacterium SID2]|nr:Uma2 family endonuclease [Cyanobacteria bacterium SID2]MBP0003300.1 Uma2 family endonuclease [Cyanobacteria bacterium SBC]